MADALILFVEHTLPGEIAEQLSDVLRFLRQGNYKAIFIEEQVQLLLGHIDTDELLGDAKITTEHDWNDCIFRRLGIILKGRSSEAREAKNDPRYLQHLFFIVAFAALQLFFQANVTGPTVAFSITKLLFPLQLNENNNTLAALRTTLIQSLSLDGVAAYKLMPYPELICLAESIICCPPIVKGVESVAWLRLRLNFIRQKLLTEASASSLKDSVYSDVEKALTSIDQSSDTTLKESILPSFLLERAAIHLYYGFDKKAREDLGEVAKRRGFLFALTGKLGKRTKYQEHNLSQLVVLAKSDEIFENNYGTGTGSSTKPKTLDLDNDTLLESISFKQESRISPQIVHDAEKLPQTLASLDPGNQPLLKPLDSIVLLSWASSITNTSPEDGLTREETLPYVLRVLDGGSSNWQVYTQALLVRSRIEGYKSRTTERGLLQLQALVDQVIAETRKDEESDTHEASRATTFLPQAKEGESAPVDERLKYVYALSSPLLWELEAELAARWVSLGGLRSALEIYERLEMWPEAALCWAATEREDKAKRIVRRQLFHSTKGQDSDVDLETDNWEGEARDPPPGDAPRLYCILGDLDADIEMYEQAWEVSNKRYARAQRSLGRLYFGSRNFEKSAEAYAKSLNINQLNGSTWFALGCALLELAAFDKAVEAFARTVQLDDTDAEAWSNLAAALIRRGPAETPTNGKKESSQPLDDEENPTTDIAPHNKDADQQHKRDALRAFKRAASLKYDNARIWDNVLTVAASLEPPAFADIVAAQARLVELRGKVEGEKSVDVDIFEALVRFVVSKYSSPTAEDASRNGAAPLRGLPSLVDDLIEIHIKPLVTTSSRLWTSIATYELWRGRPARALEAHEKAWRAATNAHEGWETGSEEQWNDVVDATVQLVDAYENLGSPESSETAGGVVMKDWRFKARSAIRGILGRAKNAWEDTPGWNTLNESLAGLKQEK